MKYKISILAIIVTPLLLLAMPGYEVKYYDYNGSTTTFTDIFHTQDDGYVVCGYKQGSGGMIAKMDADCEIVWEQNYPEGIHINSIIQTDAGDYLAGCAVDNVGFTAILLNENGDENWTRTFGRGRCFSVIELKSGEFALAGYVEDQGFIALVDSNGETIWSFSNENNPSSRNSTIRSIKEAENGIIS